MDYRREIDGLRAIAVVAVVLCHAGFTAFGGGYVGVDVFFVISGYLITSLILIDKQAGTFSVAAFYERRARRILPALFFVILCCLPFAWAWMLPEHLRNFAQSVAAVSLFASNVLFWIERGYFDADAAVKPLLHTWSLAVEEQYYLIFPLFIVAAWRFGLRMVTAAIAIAAVGSLALSEWGWRNLPDATFFLLPARCWELLIGSLTALYLNRRRRPDGPWNQSAAALGLTLVVAAVFAYDDATPFPSLYALAPTIGTALIILFATPRTLVHRLLSLPALTGVGLISYSVYLWHQPLFAFARLQAVTEPSAALLGALTAASLVLGWLSWRFVERPLRNRGQFSRRQIFTASAMASVVMAGVGLAGHVANGVESRLTRAQADILDRRDRLYVERQDATRSGTCHFNARGANADLGDFLAQWNCVGGERTRFAVVGDSHSADVAIGFLRNGIDVFQLGGAGCSLSPARMVSLAYCRRLFDFAIAKLQEAENVDVLLLVNRFDDAERRAEALREALAYWRAAGKPIVLFSPRPEIYGFTRLLLEDNVVDHAELFQVDELTVDEDLLSAHGATMADSHTLFCAMTGTCSYLDASGELLMVDGHHLSRKGAQLFVERFLATWQAPSATGTK